VPKVLVVDDDKGMRRLLKTLFELEGYEVEVAAAYDEVFPAVRRALPDIILMDVRLEGRETTSLVGQMQGEGSLSQIPIVMTSGMDLRRECLEAGAKLFILKPFLPDELVTIIGDLLAQQ
jgi:CheY-like chemotaxis protein